MIRSVTAGYFAASGSALRAGRFFTDRERVPVALISESLAHRLWPRETPAAVVGRTIRQGDVTGPLISRGRSGGRCPSWRASIASCRRSSIGPTINGQADR